MKGIEIPFGAKDSELCGWEYTIPEGMEAVVKDGKVIVRRKESEDERVRKAALEGIEYLEHKLGWDFIGDTDILNVKEYLERQKEQPMSAEEVLIRAGLKPYRDGNQWCVLAGGNIQEGICGFGDTIDEALYQFLMEVLKIQKEQKPLSTEETERNSIAFLEQLGYTCIPPGAEQKPADDKAFEEWIDNWWKYNKVNNPDSYDKGDEIQFDERGFKNFCRGIRNMYAEPKPAEWSEEDEKTIDEAAEDGWAVYEYRESPKGLYSTCYIDGFKAGAEWMAGQGWISVDERLPEMDEEVIVLSDELGTAPIYKIGFGHIVDVNRCIDYNGWNCPGVKYWMPCPKIPGMND